MTNTNIDNINIEEPKRYHCRHVFTDGRRCRAISLRSENFCYYHHTSRRPAPRQSKDQTSAFDLPLVEDRSSIQASISQILQRIAANELDPRRAGLLLYGLQIASLNLPRDQREPDSAPEPTIDDITLHPELGPLAPQTEFSTRRGSTITIEWDQWEHKNSRLFEVKRELADLQEQLRKANEQLRQKNQEPPSSSHNDIATPAILPNLNATAEPATNRVHHLRDGLIVAKVGNRAKARYAFTQPTTNAGVPHPSRSEGWERRMSGNRRHCRSRVETKKIVQASAWSNPSIAIDSKSLTSCVGVSRGVPIAFSQPKPNIRPLKLKRHVRLQTNTGQGVVLSLGGSSCRIMLRNHRDRKPHR